MAMDVLCLSTILLEWLMITSSLRTSSLFAGLARVVLFHNLFPSATDQRTAVVSSYVDSVPLITFSRERGFVTPISGMWP
ncbi:hypothetical protein RUA8715_02280 [Ruegeria arenilitoris]|uniref:Uncharacterized protein n=1 Tax=Ruegeria arenilitoris TaxID=1173585 RepID=A0A238KLS6_9RHOB|nr:hypothetical protein RUA8715_02280 [Ruegeria arenilitoris]